MTRHFFFGMLLSLAYPVSAAAGLAEVLDLPENRASLDALTRATETLNRVDLLHLGRASAPVRIDLVRRARSHVFITAPYWFDDTEGRRFMDEIDVRREEMLSTPARLDLRILSGWESPASSGDFFATKQYRELKKLAGGRLALWNPLWNFRPWSLNLPGNRLHDKILVADGRRMIMGGMNVADAYLQGGLTPEGWHDTDILIEGPGAQEGQKIFLKSYLLQQYLDNVMNPFPSDPVFQIGLLQHLFYFGGSEYEYRGERIGAFRQKFKFGYGDFLKSARYFPELMPRDDWNVPVRLIYENPLVDRKPGTHKHVSKLLDTIEFILPRVERSMKVFLPYPTFSKRMIRLLTRAAKRLEVTLITNSRISHDLGIYPYIAGVAGYDELLAAGVKIHEWQGHAPLKAFEKANGCAIDGYWPGHTLHTKAMILDDEVALIGSHNFNLRSEKMNTEIMALVRDAGFARKLAKVFRYDLDFLADAPDGKRLLQCGGRRLEGRPRRTHPVDSRYVAWLKQKYGVAPELLDKVKWMF